VGRLLTVLVGAMLLAACQNDTHAVFSPVPTATPHTAPTAAILQSNDVPPAFQACLGSGPVDVYLSVLSTTAPEVASSAAAYWSKLQGQGAIAGAISVFVANPSACTAELGAKTAVKSIASFVALFADEGQADRAWQEGVFGFTPPPVGELAPGVTRGTSTGLGPSSFVYLTSSVRLASWRRSVLVALVVASNGDANLFNVATAAIDQRLN
jgi:hypothetical protein